MDAALAGRWIEASATSTRPPGDLVVSVRPPTVFAHASATACEGSRGLLRDPWRSVARAVTVLLSPQGRPAAQIATLLERTPATARRWITRVNTGGVAVLDDRPRCGRHRPGGSLLTARITVLPQRPAPETVLRLHPCPGRPQSSRRTLHRRVRQVPVWRRPKPVAPGAGLRWRWLRSPNGCAAHGDCGVPYAGRCRPGRWSGPPTRPTRTYCRTSAPAGRGPPPGRTSPSRARTAGSPWWARRKSPVPPSATDSAADVPPTSSTRSSNCRQPARPGDRGDLRQRPDPPGPRRARVRRHPAWDAPVVGRQLQPAGQPHRRRLSRTQALHRRHRRRPTGPPTTGRRLLPQPLSRPAPGRRRVLTSPWFTTS